jgi:hypothetical protein
VFLYSNKGPQQHQHMDLTSGTPKLWKGKGKGKVNPWRQRPDRKTITIGVVTALSKEGMWFTYAPGKVAGKVTSPTDCKLVKMFVPYGETVIFHGTLVHCGSPSEIPNYRWHLYFVLLLDDEHIFREPSNGTTLVYDPLCQLCKEVRPQPTQKS